MSENQEVDNRLELAIVVAYFQSMAKEYGSFFDTIDQSIKLGELFTNKFDGVVWGVEGDLDYEETLEKFFNENFKHRNKL